jgi:single-strand DNA-binding protein
MNKFYGVGYLVADLESREVGDKLVANGAIAISRKYAIDKTDFVNISIWGKSAEYALKYAKKGTMIAIAGELQIEKKNDKIYTRVNVDDFKFWNNKKDDIKEESTLDKTDEEYIKNFFKDTTSDLPF